MNGNGTTNIEGLFAFDSQDILAIHGRLFKSYINGKSIVQFSLCLDVFFLLITQELVFAHLPNLG